MRTMLPGPSVIGFIIFLFALTENCFGFSAVRPADLSTGPFKGFVDLGNGMSLYSEYHAGRSDRPVVVLLNGMTYSTQSWLPFMQPLLRDGFGLLTYDARGMGRTLERQGAIRQTLPLMQQVEDLHLLLQALKIARPVDLVGLSYGGALGLQFAARYPLQVRKLVAMAPYLKPLPVVDSLIQSWVHWTRALFPWHPYSNQQLHEYYFHLFAYATFPGSEPVVLAHPYKLEAAIHLAIGLGEFKIESVAAQLPQQRVHLITGSREEYIPQDLFNDFWQQITGGPGASRLDISDSRHKIPEEVPEYAAAWTRLILLDDSRLANGRWFRGSATQRTARDNKETIEL